MTTTFRIAESTVTVESIGAEYDPNDAGYRQRYLATITANGWEYVTNDLRSGVGADVDELAMAETLCSFLYACAESRDYDGGENSNLFPEHVGQWAQDNADELAMWMEHD